jgi:histidinol-phosphatase (PHP family)
MVTSGKFVKMQLRDQHVHSKYSFDSESEPTEVCRLAVERGLGGVVFTEHFDTHPTEWPGCVYDYARLVDLQAELRAEFGNRLSVGLGIEVCYQPDNMGFILDYLSKRQFDLVILSVHWFYGRAVHFKESWAGLDLAEGTRRYLRTVLEAARLCADLNRKGSSPFDVLGHLDFAKRYTHIFFNENRAADGRDIIDEILRACLEADLIPEINVSPLRRGLDEPMPAAHTVRRYRELGGRCMSVGSDAHRPSDVGRDLRHAADMIAEAGLEGLALFQQGRYRVEPI